MFFGIFLLTLASSGLFAQQHDPMYDRYNEVVKRCPYTASQGNVRKQRFRTAELYNGMDDARWNRFIAQCERNEAHVPRPMEAPANTLVNAPEKEHTRIVKRPAEAPPGVHYRCNPDTLMPDPNSRTICGPVPPKASAN